MKTHPMLPLWREFAAEPEVIYLGDGTRRLVVRDDDFRLFVFVAIRRAGWDLSLTPRGEEKAKWKPRKRGRPPKPHHPGDEMPPWPTAHDDWMPPVVLCEPGGPISGIRKGLPGLVVSPDDEVPKSIKRTLQKRWSWRGRRFRDLIPFVPVLLDSEVAECESCGTFYKADGSAVCDSCAADYDPEPLFRWLDAEDEFEDWLESIGGEEVLAAMSDGEISALLARESTSRDSVGRLSVQS